MAKYSVINTTTGEQKEMNMSVHDWDQWKKDNPEWDTNWGAWNTAPGLCEVGEWKDKLIKKHPGWNEVLAKVNKSGASQSQMGKI